MMTCLTEDELVQHLDQQLTVDRTRQVADHLQACTSCQRRLEGLHKLADQIAAPVTDDDGSAFIHQTLAAMDSQQRRAAPWGRYAAAAAVLLVAAPVALFALRGRLVDEGAPGSGATQQTYAPRGHVPDASPRGTLERLTGVEALLVSGKKHHPLPSRGGTLPVAAGLAFRTTNATGSDLYLLAFALDSAGEVHWFYPAYTDPGENPPAVPLLGRQRSVLLPHTVRPQGHPPGALRVVSVISAEERRVKQVEKLLEGATTASSIAHRFRGDHVQQWLITSEASP